MGLLAAYTCLLEQDDRGIYLLARECASLCIRLRLQHVAKTGSAEIVQKNHPIQPNYAGEYVPRGSDFGKIHW